MITNANITPSSVFLASGGGRGITAECVIKLAKRYPCKWILLGRSELTGEEPSWAKDCFDESEFKKRIMQNLLSQGKKPKPVDIQKVFKKISSERDIRKTLQTLADLGRQAEYLSADVTNLAVLKEKLGGATQRLGAITGIIHGAGNLADKLIEKKTEQDFDSVYRAKVQGLDNLFNCVPVSQLEYLVLFSSVAGFYGNAGQVDYSLANEILNKTAHLVKQHHPNCHVVAINWGPWDSGMVTPQLKKAFAMRKVEIIPIDAGTQILADELADVNQETVQVIVGSPLPPATGELSSELRTHRIHRQLTLAENPFLYDHVIAGSPVLPFTCAISWMASSTSLLYPGYQCFSCQETKVLKGIVFDNQLAEKYTLDIKELSKNSEVIELETKIWSKNSDGKTRYHFSANIQLLKEIPEAPIYEGLDLTPDRKISGSRESFYQNGTASLFHGPAFQGVDRIVNLSPQKITVQCLVKSLGERQQGQFPIYNICPYIADVQTHSVWLWLQHMHQSGCLPAKLGKFEQFAPVPHDAIFYTSMELNSKTETSLNVNIASHDEQGKIYCRITGAQATIFPLAAINNAA
ncbi:MAG: SDR family NAD(P)-dependent oxidoreductase [Coleofasciculaceae cyanobacterium]